MVQAATRHKKSAGRSIRPPEGALYSRTSFSIVDGVRHARKIPLAAVPAFPVLSKSGLKTKNEKPCPSVLVAGKVVHLKSGRAAIGLALQHAGIATGHEVLVPAYHCREMIPPIIAAGCKPVFYKIQKDFTPDWDDIAQKVSSCTKAMLAVHYFGFPQKAGEIQAFCEENGLIFIEDCAHAFFGSYNDRPLGSFGHYAIASTRKFFPIQEGGALVISRSIVISRSLAGEISPLTAPGIRENLRQLKAGIEKAVSYGRLRTFRPLLAALDYLLQLTKGKQAPAHSSAPDKPVDEMVVYLEHHRGQGMTKIARMIVDRTSFKRAAELRRRNYLLLRDGLSGLSDCHILLPDLPKGCVPYLFPLMIDDLEAIFPALEDAAIPMQRFGQFLWDEIDENVCTVSTGFSRKCVQISCHQDLTIQEMQWIVDSLCRIMGKGERS